MEENKTNSPKQLVIGILIAVVLLGFAGYTLYQNSKLSDSNAFLIDEKTKIQQELDETIAKYDDAIAENGELSDELRIERDKIIALRDSVTTLKANYSSLRKYRNQAISYKNKYNALMEVNDSLKASNDLLTMNLDSANTFIASQTVVLDSLNTSNKELNTKVGLGAQLNANSLKATSMKKKSSGKLVETSKASRTDAIRVSFIAAKNVLANAGQKSALIQVLNPKGQVVRVTSTAVLSDNSEIEISGETPFDYANEDIEVITLIDVNKKTNVSGKYVVNVYLDGRLSAVTSVTLK